MKGLQSYYEQAILSLDCQAKLEQFPINGLTFHAVTAGPKEGKLILLLHGFPECWYTWRKQIPYFASQGFRVVAPDLRGYGMNDKPKSIEDYHITNLVEDIRQLILQQKKQSAIIVAHDWGGAAAWNFAMWHPQMTERLVILNAPHPVLFSRELRDRTSEQHKMSWYMRFFQKPRWPEKVLTADFTRTANWFFNDKFGHATYNEEDLALYAASYAVPDAMSALLNWYRASFQLRGKAIPENKVINAPTLVIWGVNDQALSIKLLDGLEEWVPSIEIRRISEAGHFVQNDASDKVNEEISVFLAR